MGSAVDSSRIDSPRLHLPKSLRMLKCCLSLLVLAVATLARPQVPEQQWTPAQQIALRQHASIAAANQPNPLAELPGWDQHQAQLAEVYALQGIDPGEQAHEAAIARVLAQEQELAAINY